MHLRHAASLSGFANVGEPLLLLLVWTGRQDPGAGCPVLSFPAGRTPPLLTACLLLVLTPTFNSCKPVQLPAWSRAGSSAEEIPIYSHFPNVAYLSTRCAHRQQREKKGRGRRRQQGKDRAGRAKKKEEGLLGTGLASLLYVVRVSE